jgi:hypothetical protein
MNAGEDRTEPLLTPEVSTLTVSTAQLGQRLTGLGDSGSRKRPTPPSDPSAAV